MKEIRCKECVFRGKPRKNMCDYAWLVGHTRKAQPPEKYTYFIAGEKLESPEAAAEFLKKRTEPKAVERQTKPARKKVNWEKAEELYRTGANDGEIAREIGVSPSTVCNWRRRNQLPANATSGGRHGDKGDHSRNPAAAQPLAALPLTDAAYPLRVSGCDVERTSSEVSELLAKAGSEGYGACEEADRTGQDRTGGGACEGGEEDHEERNQGPHTEDAAGGCGHKKMGAGSGADPGTRWKTGAGGIPRGAAGQGGL